MNHSDRSGRNVFLVSLAVFGLLILPIVRADRFYIDDLGRSLHGYLGWGSDGRPLSNVVMELLNLSTPLVDASPVPQLVSGGLFAWLAVIIHRRIGVKNPWVVALTVLPLIGSPFYLENLSYKFDIVPMTVALFLGATAALARRLSLGQLALGAVALLACFCLYQPAINVFLVFAVLCTFLRQADGAPPLEILKLLTARAIQLATASVAYSIIAARTVRGGYASGHADLALGQGMMDTVLDNLRASVAYSVHGLQGGGGNALLVSIVAGLIGACLIVIVYAKSLRPKGGTAIATLWLLLGMGLVLAMVLAAWGPLLLLRAPVLMPRTQMGIGALGSASLILIITLATRRGISTTWQLGALVCCAYPALLFASVYGNSLGAQKNYEDALSDAIAEEVYAVGLTHGVQRVAIKGTSGLAPVAQHNAKKYPFLARLVPAYLTQGWGWAGSQLKHARASAPLAMLTDDELQRLGNCSARLLSRHRSYDFYAVDDLAVVWFRDVDAPTCPALHP